MLDVLVSQDVTCHHRVDCVVDEYLYADKIGKSLDLSLSLSLSVYDI